MTEYRVKKVVDGNGYTRYYPQRKWLGIWWYYHSFSSLDANGFFQIRSRLSFDGAIEIISNSKMNKKRKKTQSIEYTYFNTEETNIGGE